MMEIDARTSHSNEKRPLENSTPLNEQKKPMENSQSTSVFVNHALIAWNESRRKWTGNVSQRSDRTIKDQIIRLLYGTQTLYNLLFKKFHNVDNWSTTYEDLLSTQDPFPEPIPLPEMVDFLVDIWHDEGLYD